MIFSSPIFLFLFFPLLLVFYFFAKTSFQNGVLLVFSLIFYAWGEPVYILVMLLSISVNYLLAFLIDYSQQHKPQYKKLTLITAVVFNIGMLFYYKYINFFIENINSFGERYRWSEVPSVSVIMPIGISFFTFQILSYVIDVYKQEVDVQKKIVNLALYISLFPQLIAGPIVRYADVAAEIENRKTTLESFANGLRRFIMGLSKKVLIANNVALVADSIFSLKSGNLSFSVAWIGIICYTLQIYFDFSGYSDMAIGLGEIFGFHFLENFKYPYISSSITEFWRRWHISLSTWFRDYLYIPLGGNRKGKYRTYVNSLIVFLMTGFWHGASWNFIVWGLYHGIFLTLEKIKGQKKLKQLELCKSNGFFKGFHHFITLLIIMVGWVFFRAETLPLALDYLSAMFYLTTPKEVLFTLSYYLTTKVCLVLFCGMVLCTPCVKQLFESKKANIQVVILKDVFLIGLLGLSIMALASSAYNPFIYFRF